MSKKSNSVPQAMRKVFSEITALTDSFCDKHLNEEYADLSRGLVAALARKRPSPLARGKPEVWACGAIYALGTVNFLFDRSQTPHMRSDEICAAFGVNKSTGGGKAKLIRDMFKMSYFDPTWTLPSRMDENPLIWMLNVNGFIMDVRSAPREIQEIAFQKGLIPYIPADR
jgi:hypothetical protein